MNYFKKDIAIVGAGISGAVLARQFAEAGCKVSIFEAKPVHSGNIRTEEEHGIHVHKFGAHIFHTDNKTVWDYVNRFAEWNTYRHHVIANADDEIVPLPFSMFTFAKLFGVKTPEEAKLRIESETLPFRNIEPKNLEEQALKLVGPTIYEKLIKSYTEKQWGRDCTEIPASVIKRLPLRFTYDSNYFFDRYQGIPVNGYTALVEEMLNHPNIHITYNKEISLSKLDMLQDVYDYTFFSGALDDLFEYSEGTLEYRSLEFKNKVLDTDNFQGHSVVNYTTSEDFTRIIEHRHFMQNCESDKTIISEEYPREWKFGDERYYPIGNPVNRAIHKKYTDKLSGMFGHKVIPIGRLAEYKYYDMDDSVENALNIFERVKNTIVKEIQGIQ